MKLVTKMTQNKAFKAGISFNLPRMNFRTLTGYLSTRRKHNYLNIFKQKELKCHNSVLRTKD